MAANTKGAGENGKETPRFEDALKRLESIVESMENGDLPLETLLARFEEGTRLVKICQDQLEQAELKVKQLEKDPSGELVLKSLETGAEGK